MPVLQAIRDFLNAQASSFDEKQHEPTFTSEESARARGESLSIGAKALVIKTDDQYRLFVLPADRKVDSQAIRRALGAKKTRFANAEELAELTGLVPGSVPPFRPADSCARAVCRPGPVRQRQDRVQRRLAHDVDHHAHRPTTDACAEPHGWRFQQARTSAGNCLEASMVTLPDILSGQLLFH